MKCHQCCECYQCAGIHNIHSIQNIHSIHSIQNIQKVRYFIRLSYRGAPYHGWQTQPHDTSVQETIEQALGTLLRTPVAITGAGRTDTGVNAAMMIAHFDAPVIADTSQLCHRLNCILGRDIAVHSIFAVHPQAHARFDATSRTYKYFITTAKDPFLHTLSWQCPPTLDFDAMNRAADRLSHYRDFTSFSKLHTDVKTNNCLISHAQWTQHDRHTWVFTITADRFLRNMVRAIVGTLMLVGRHKISVGDFESIIQRRDRCSAGESVPGHALFLWQITYPYPIE